jgi:hypothetical protein
MFRTPERNLTARHGIFLRGMKGAEFFCRQSEDFWRMHSTSSLTIPQPLGEQSSHATPRADALHFRPRNSRCHLLLWAGRSFAFSLKGTDKQRALARQITT